MIITAGALGIFKGGASKRSRGIIDRQGRLSHCCSPHRSQPRLQTLSTVPAQAEGINRAKALKLGPHMLLRRWRLRRLLRDQRVGVAMYQAPLIALAPE